MLYQQINNTKQNTIKYLRGYTRRVILFAHFYSILIKATDNSKLEFLVEYLVKDDGDDDASEVRGDQESRFITKNSNLRTVATQ